MTTLIPKTTPPFCHAWKMVSHWEAIISLSLEELEASSSSASPPLESPLSTSFSSDTSREGVGKATKPLRWACHLAIRLTQVVTWHNSSLRLLRRASMHWSCTIIASMVTPPAEKEGKDGEEVEEAGGVAILVLGRFDQSWASLRRTITSSMAHITKKWSDMGKEIEKRQRILVIVEGKICLS